MITQREAKRQILTQWDEWPAKTGSESEAEKHAFYTWLQSHHPTLLRFPGDGDKWEVVKVWLRGR